MKPVYVEWAKAFFACDHDPHVYTDDEADMRIVSLPVRLDSMVCAAIAASWHAGVTYGMERGKEQALYSIRAALGIKL